MSKEKDIKDFLGKPENYSRYTPPRVPSLDPNITPNTSVYNEIYGKSVFLMCTEVLAMAASSLLTAPFTTIQVSLQLSVKPHQNLYGDVSGQAAKDLMNIPKEITVQDRRKYELLVKSGTVGTNKPFRAPVYTGYREVLQSLSNQGLLGFYKGNLFGWLHYATNTYFKFEVLQAIEYSSFRWQMQDSGWKTLAATMLGGTLTDIMTNPILIAQSRFILQNRLPSFQLYRSGAHFFRKLGIYSSKWRLGYQVHLPKNVILALTRVNPIFEDSKINFLAGNHLAQTLVYPLLTVMRRLQCQDPAPGMIPLRYSGAFHAFKLILKEEGFKGLYSGYLAFSAGHAIFLMGSITAWRSATDYFETRFDL